MLIRSYTLFALYSVFVLITGCATLGDPLPSWQESNSKQAITEFVESATDKNSDNYVPTADRIAVFDNDGTLWSEQPVYFQALFVFDRIRAMADEHPEWQTQEPFASVIKGDLNAALAGGEESLLEMVLATHAGQTGDEYHALVLDWITTARHPKSGRPYTDMVYQPMLELLNYLRDNDFKTYIVSGGGTAFMRPWVQAVYGISPDQVIGSRLKAEFVYNEGDAQVVRQPAIDFINDKAGKPVGIYHGIGQRPLMAFGNSDGDQQMLQWTMNGDGPRFAALVHHTDNEREVAYDRDSHVGRLDSALDQARNDGWTLIDMKADWLHVFPPQP